MRGREVGRAGRSFHGLDAANNYRERSPSPQRCWDLVRSTSFRPVDLRAGEEDSSSARRLRRFAGGCGALMRIFHRINVFAVPLRMRNAARGNDLVQLEGDRGLALPAVHLPAIRLVWPLSIPTRTLRSRTSPMTKVDSSQLKASAKTCLRCSSVDGEALAEVQNQAKVTRYR